LANAIPLTKKLYPSPFGDIFIKPNTVFPTSTDNDSIHIGVNSGANSTRVDSIKVTSLTLNISVFLTPEMASIQPADIKLSVVLPPGRVRMLNGASNVVSVTPAAYAQPVTVVITDFMLNTSSGATGIPVQLIVDAKSGNLPLTLTANSAITCLISLIRINYAVAYGNFDASANVSSIHQRPLNVAQNFPNGLLKLTTSQLKITATTNMGTYLSFQIDYMKAFVNSDPTIAPVYAWFNNHTTNSVTEQFDVKPKLPGLWVTKEFKTFDKDFGETNQLFDTSNRRDMIEYKFTAGINQSLVKSDPTPSFITPDAGLKVTILTKIPFQLNKDSYYEFNDTISNIFEQISAAFNKYTYNTASSVTLVLNVKNGLPVKTQIDLKFLDLDGRELQTDFEKSYKLEAGNVDIGGIVQPGNENKQTILIKATKSQLDALKSAHKLAYSVRIDGKNVDSNIHFTKLNTFDVKIGLYISNI
jgi:hypothetical protein